MLREDGNAQSQDKKGKPAGVALLRMDFVNTLSHEFKTPLISIRGFARLLQNDDLTPEQRRAYADTVVLRQGEGEITVSISDTGIGMDEETQRHIFDKFYRAAPYPDDRGNGLGLSIVRRVVKLCGGQVAVFSRPGNGSTFTVTLPAAGE